MYRSLKFRLVLVVIVLVLLPAAEVISSVYNNVGSIIMSKRLQAAAGPDKSAISTQGFDQAIFYFAKAMGWDHSNSRAYYNIGFLFSLKGDNTRAVSFLTMASSLGPSNPLTHLKLAEVLDKSGRREEAIAEFERSAPPRLDLEITDLVDLSPGYLELGSKDDEVAAVQRSRYGRYAENLVNDYLSVAGDLMKARKGDSAIPLLEKALRLAPDNRFALYQLAIAYSESESREKSLWASDTLRKLPYLVLRGINSAQPSSFDREIDRIIWTPEYYVQFYTALTRSLTAVLSISEDRLETSYLLGKYLLRAGDRQGGVRQYLDILQSAAIQGISRERMGRMYSSLAANSLGSGEIDRAIDLYQRALLQDGRIIEANRGLRGLYLTKGMLSQVSELDFQLASLLPEHQLNQGQGIKIGEEAVLIGFDFDEDDLDIGAEIQVTLYWRLDRSPSASTGKVYAAGDRYIEVRMVHNAAPNGGFEWDKDSNHVSFPYGWPLPIMDAPSRPSKSYFKSLGHESECCQLTSEERSGRKTRTMRLGPTAEYPHESGLGSFEVTVLPGRQYLLGAWLRSNGGIGYLEQYWPSEWQAGVTQPYRFVSTDVTYSDWQYHAGILLQPPGAEKSRVRVFNYRAPGGSVYVDDVLLFEVVPPIQGGSS